MTATMRAVVLDAPGPPEALQIRELLVPEPRPGWVLIGVKAFGINRSELHTRLGLAQGVTFPRVLGIEATGVVAAAPGGEFEEGHQVAATTATSRPRRERSFPTASMPRSSWSAPTRSPTPCAPPPSTASCASPGC